MKKSVLVIHHGKHLRIFSIYRSFLWVFYFIQILESTNLVIFVSILRHYIIFGDRLIKQPFSNHSNFFGHMDNSVIFGWEISRNPLRIVLQDVFWR